MSIESLNNTLIQRIVVGVAVMVLLGTFVIGALMGAVAYEWKASVRQGNEGATLVMPCAVESVPLA